MLLHHLYRYTPEADAQDNPAPVVLLHGLFGSAANLGMVARGLAPHFPVYSVDLPNHGHSPRLDRMDYPSMAAEVIEFLEQNALAPAHLLGHSMGGKVAMQVALQRPELVNQLIVADIAPVRYPGHHDQILAGLDAVARIAPQGRREADAVLSEYVEESGVRAFLLKSWQKDDQDRYNWLLNLDAIRSSYPLLGEANQGEPYEREVFFIKGSESSYILPEHRDQILTLFPHATVKVLEGTGHWLHAEKPQLFNRLVLRFLQR